MGQISCEEVSDEGQTRIGTNWILTDKVVNGVGTIKARLTVRGDQEETSGIRKDSPTFRRGNIKDIFSGGSKRTLGDQSQ